MTRRGGDLGRLLVRPVGRRLSAYNAEQLEHSQPRVDWLSYVVTPEFWEDTLQNWQSEFLAVGSVVIFSVYLRQRGSTQSKPVGAPHAETGAEG